MHLVKLNCDTSFTKELEYAGLAGVIKNSMEHWLAGYQRKCYVKSFLMGKIIATLNRLTFVTNPRWSKVIINSDSKEAIDIIQDQVNVDCDVNYNMIMQCRALICGIENLKLEHASRSTNRATYILAKLCRTSNYNN